MAAISTGRIVMKKVVFGFCSAALCGSGSDQKRQALGEGGALPTVRDVVGNPFGFLPPISPLPVPAVTRCVLEVTAAGY
jgi:hypothetical protein